MVERALKFMRILQSLWFCLTAYGNRVSIFGFARKTRLQENASQLCPISHVNVMFCVAGFRPGRRGPFGLAKGPKTIDAPSGLIESGRTPILGGRSNSLGSNKARQRIRASLPWARRQASDHGRGC